MSAGSDQTIWRLEVYPNHEDGYGVFLRLMSAEEKINVSFQFAIVDKKNKVIESYDRSRCFAMTQNYCGRYFNRTQLFDAISPSYVFTLVCNIKLIESADFHPLELNISEELQKICHNEFFDMKMKVDGQTILAHKLIISAASPFLHERIKEMSDFTDTLELVGHSFDTIQEVTNFIYKKEFKMDEDNVKNILLAANKYEIKSLQMKCEKFMTENLTIDNALNTLLFVDAVVNETLSEKTYDFVENNIALLMSNEENWQKFITEHTSTFKDLFEKIFLNLSKNFSKNYIAESSKWSSPNVSSKDISVNNSNVINDLEKLYQTMQHSDVVFEIDGNILKGHKAILSCRSKVFAEILETQENPIKIEDCDYNTMKDLLRFIYTGNVFISEENLANTFSVANKYDLTELKDLCKEWMVENMRCENVIEIFKFASLHKCLSDIKEKAFLFIFENFQDEILNWEEFARSNSKILNEFLMESLKLTEKQ